MTGNRQFDRATGWVFAFLTIPWLSLVAQAEDWPAYRHDNRRSGATAEQIPAASLSEQWVYRSPQPPQPAWHGPAKWDAYAGIRGLRSMRNYDPVFHPIVVGERVYFSSSADDSVHCIDALSGESLFEFCTDGPVRSAPAYAAGKLYFGSDDGHAYCIDAADGSLIWKFRPTVPDRLILHNGRFIPLSPCRTGVLVSDGIAYFANALLPWEPSYLCAVDADTGKADGDGSFVRRINGITLEGPMLASQAQLFVPQGRLPPRVFKRQDGGSVGSLKGGGGCFVLLTDDEHLLHGPGNKTGWITDSNAKTRTQVATYKNGNAMIVSGERAYLLTDHTLSAVDRAKQKPLWSTACEYPYELILAGDVLFAGGEDVVAAIDAADGSLLWEHPVKGRAYGLAAANGGLFVATDYGHIYAFRDGGSPGRRDGRDVVETTANEATAHLPVTAVDAIDDEHLLGRWVFQSGPVTGRVAKNLAGGRNAAIQGQADLQIVDDRQALVLDGHSTSVLVTPDHTKARLPTEEITAEAWVRIDEPQPWGGIVGAIQDNGEYERGWSLGYRDTKLSFAICGTEGPGRLTFLTAQSDFEPGRWYHVVGTYDGGRTAIYVDGKLESSSEEQRGPINYPARAFYEIGAYHDKDEYYHTSGRLHEVRVYNRVLGDDEIAAHAAKKQFHIAERIELASGPYLEFNGPESALLRWETQEPSPSIVEYGRKGFSRQIDEPALKTSHEVTLTGLRRNREYAYVIKTLIDGRKGETPQFECDTNFNFHVPEPPASTTFDESPDAAQFADAAEQILSQCPTRSGICLVLGVGEGRLAYELVKATKMRIIGVDTNEDNVAQARRRFKEMGIYGSRVAVRHVDSLDDLPFTSDFANLVVSEQMMVTGQSAGAATEVTRVLRPDGGVAVLGQPAGFKTELSRATLDEWLAAASIEHRLTAGDGGLWARIERPALAGAGVWSHQYGKADNSAYGNENLRGASATADFQVQWIGRPGPRFQPDRNGRKPSPLAVGGRMFVQGLHRIAALDVYNGSVLWAREIPPLARFNMPRDCGNWCADEEHLFVAIDDECWRFDAETGNLSKRFPVPAGPNHAWSYDWSYIARAGDKLIGSAVKEGTAFTNFWGGTGWYDATGGEATAKVCSECLFAVDPTTGQTVWDYADGVIINSTITAAGSTVYFVESRNSAVKASGTRQVLLPELWDDQFLVAVDVNSGSKLWERPLKTVPGTVVFFMAHGDDTLVIVSSADKKYHVYAYEAADGSALWNTSIDWPGDNHGAHMSRPAIVNGKVFVRPQAFDLATGEVLDAVMPGGGCGTYACTDAALFFRSTFPTGRLATVWDQATSKGTAWPRLRPDCWLSTIPACGMLLSPEGGGGCSCGSWMETSIGFVPVAAKRTD